MNAGAGMYRTKSVSGSKNPSIARKVPIIRPSGTARIAAIANPIQTRFVLAQTSVQNSPLR